ncbi:MAG: DUF1566 domain-containing protein [Desulfatibacillaceae bacterium]|nr:DUF1566 domain-containing protein [Desulfatibacillaceae bacterium]
MSCRKMESKTPGRRTFLPKAFMWGLFALLALWQGGALALAATAPYTGQNKCYNNNGEIVCPQPGEPFYGQDAQYPGPRSFTKLGNNGQPLADNALEWRTVADNFTGLVWEVKQDADGFANYGNLNDADNTYAWYDDVEFPDDGDEEKGFWNNEVNTQVFINALNAARYGGFSDWRLPTVAELATLILPDGSHPAINQKYFPNTSLGPYWSSTTYLADAQGDALKAWRVRFGHPIANNEPASGIVIEESKAVEFFARAVRGFMDPHGGGFTGNDDVPAQDRTTTDIDSGLMWWTPMGPDDEDPDAPANNAAMAQLDIRRTWQEALAFCEEVAAAGYAGFGDWRMPSRTEMQSLLNYRTVPLSDLDSFPPPEEKNARFWTATTNALKPDEAWRINIDYGRIESSVKTDEYFVRPVRGGYSGPLAPDAIISPAQGGVFGLGENMEIRWNKDAFDAPENPVGNDPRILIRLSRDGGKTFFRINTPNPSPNTGLFVWKAAGAATNNAVLRISQQIDANDPVGDQDKWIEMGLFSIITRPDDTPPPQRQVTGGATDSGGGGCFINSLQP